SAAFPTRWISLRSPMEPSANSGVCTTRHRGSEKLRELAACQRQPLAGTSVAKADLIFVHAGQEDRKFWGLQLYREGWATRLLISVGRYEIRRFAQLPLPEPVDLLDLAKSVDPPLRHFFVSFSPQVAQVERVQLGRFGTLGEVQALRVWLKYRPDIRNVVVVSSGPHLARIR